MTRPDTRAAFAALIGEAWFAVCETPRTFASCTAEEAATFGDMAEAVLAAARAGGRDAASVAQALCAGFWRGHPRPWAWETLSRLKREVFLEVARRTIAGGQAMRQAA